MKKIVCLVVIVLVLALVGCARIQPAVAEGPIISPAPTMAIVVSNPTQEAQQIEETPVYTEMPSMSPDLSSIKYADMIPDPKSVFVNGEIQVTDADGGKAYIFNVTGYADGEYKAYTAKCVEMGFTNVVYDDGNDKGLEFGAYTKDKQYWVQVDLDKTKNIIYVICQKSKKK